MTSRVNDLMTAVREHLNALKARAGLTDDQIAAAICARDPSVHAYQQKVSDVLSGARKHPDLDLLQAICVTLGTRLSTVLAAAERGTVVASRQETAWLAVLHRADPKRRKAVLTLLEP